MNLWTPLVTLTLSHNGWNIGSANCLNEVNIWPKFHQFLLRGLEVMEWTQNITQTARCRGQKQYVSHGGRHNSKPISITLRQNGAKFFLDVTKKSHWNKLISRVPVYFSQGTGPRGTLLIRTDMPYLIHNGYTSGLPGCGPWAKKPYTVN